MRPLLTSILILANILAYSQSGSTILFDHGNYGFDFSDLQEVMWRLDRHYQVYVGSDQDLEILKHILIETSQERSEKLIDAKVQIRNTNGIDTSFGLSSFEVQPFDADIIDHLLVIDDLRQYDTIDVRYTIKAEPSVHTYRWTVQYDYPVKESRVTYLVPKVFHSEITTTDEDQTYLKTQMTFDSTYRIPQGRIELRGLSHHYFDIPAYRAESFAPAAIESKPASLFALTEFSLASGASYLPEWSDQMVDLAVSEVFGKQYRVRSNYRWLINEAGDLLKTKYQPRLHLLLLYQFIHEHFLWDGSYGLIPSHGLAEMQYEKTVNKSALNMALLALINEADIYANPVLVGTTDRPPINRAIPNINQFNHFVIEVELSGGEKIYIDAGEPTLPPGWIDPQVRRQDAARIRNLKGIWMDIPEFSAVSKMRVNMVVKPNLGAQGTIHASFAGYDAFRERQMLADDRTGQYWKDRVSSLSPGLRIDSVRFENVNNLLLPFENTVYFHLPLEESRDSIFINPIFYSFFGTAYFIDTIRQNEVRLPFAIHEECTLDIDLPSSLGVVIPEDAKSSINGNMISSAFSSTQNEGNLKTFFKAVIPKTKYPVPEYLALKSFFDQTYGLTRKPIVLYGD